jgi:hypothetical protein
MLHSSVQLVLFMHSIRSRGNGIKFTHQSLCNPKISTLLKAVRKGLLKGCPNFSEKLILKYLNLSPATAKGHMKHPHHGIRSTQPKPTTPSIAPVSIVPPLPLHVIDRAFPTKLHPDYTQIYQAQPLYVTTLMSPSPMYFALEHSLIDIWASSTMT